jgi:hypothetical protein
VAGSDKPKLTGVSFNLFALVGLLVMLPIGTAFVTNLGNSNNSEYEPIMTANDFVWNHPYMCSNEAILIDDNNYMDWLDIGDNMTSSYEAYYGVTNANYNFMNEGYINTHTNGCNNFYYQYGDDIFWAGSNDNHFRLASQAFQFNNYQGYIGYSGDDFTFRIDENAFQHLDDTQDLSGLKLTFIDNNLGVACDNSFFRNITFDYEITLINENSSLSMFIGGFSDTQLNSYHIQYDPYNQQNDYCVESLSLDYDFTPFESIDINEKFNDYDNLSAIVRVFNIKDEFNLNYSVGVSDLVFTGDQAHQTMLEVRYVDTIKTNFFLSGGTFILGGALWLLAISSTPYWNPVVGFLGGKK